MFKKSKKTIILIISVIIILNGCSLKPKNEEPNKNIESTSIISPKIKVNEQYYRGVLPYKKSPISGMLREIPSRLDTKHFELGLLELARTYFDPLTYIFQEGQVLTMNEIEPILDSDQYSQYENFLYAVTEHDYLLEDGQFGGIVIGLLVSPKYYKKDENGVYLTDIFGSKITEFYTTEELESKTQKLINDITSIVRKKIPDEPILFAAMQSETVDAKLPGTFFLTGMVEEDKNSVNKWNSINEKYIFLPASTKFIEDGYGNLVRGFDHFKEKVEKYIPGYAGITGLARVVDGEAFEVTINVNTKFDSTVQVIQFTQFSISMLGEYFPENTHINLYVYSLDRPKAIYVKKANGDNFMHVYRD